MPGIYPAGRLDYRSEGLLILSDDGGLIRHLTDPRFKLPKVYFVQVEGQITSAVVKRLSNEIILPGFQTKLPEIEVISEPDLPPRPIPVRPYHLKSWLKIKLYEGKKHQVRRMTAAVGFPTLRLVRWAIGDISLVGMFPGEWRRLSLSEMNTFR